MKTKLTLTLLIVCFLFSVAYEVRAGFGITPPRVWNDRLVPGSHYEQTITLTRSNPTNPIEILVEVDAPDIKDWITIDKGNSFIYPAGPQQFPMTVIIDVPKDAGYTTYYGKMTLRAAPVGGKGEVTVALGAVVDLKLRVSGEEFSDFKLRGVSIPDLEEGWPVKFVVNLENLGNVKARPSKIRLDIYDSYHTKKLKSGEITDMSWVGPFEVGSSKGDLVVGLKEGQYWAEYEVYKNEEMILKDKLRFYVHPPGTLVPPPLLSRLKSYITASPLRLIIFTFIGTIILISLFMGIVYIAKRRKRKKSNSRQRGK